LLSLFCNATFRLFLHNHPSFLQLCASPIVAQETFETSDEAAATLLAGLARASHEDWISSIFEDAHPTRQIAWEMKRLGTVDEIQDTLRRNALLSRVRNSGTLASGILHALDHFSTHPGQIKPSQRRTVSYFDVLTEIDQDSPEWNVKDTLLFLERALPQRRDRVRRSQLIRRAIDSGAVDYGTWRHYLNVLQAWNIGVSRSVNAPTDSVFVFPEVQPIPLATGRIEDCTAPVEVDLTERAWIGPLTQIAWHPEQLTWDTIAIARGRLSARIPGYHNSSAEASELLLKELSQVVVDQHQGRVKRWLYLSMDSLRKNGPIGGAILSGVASLAVGWRAEHALPLAVAALLTSRAVIERFVDIIKSGDKRRTSDAIRTFGLYYRLRPFTNG
jgi:hypothetical protein